MTLGKPGVRGNPPDALDEPTDVVTDPANGDIYVAESHMNVEDPNLVGHLLAQMPQGPFMFSKATTSDQPLETRLRAARRRINDNADAIQDWLRIR